MQCVKLNHIVIGSGIPKICVPMVGKNAGELQAELDCIKEAGADLAEWRADFFAGVGDFVQVEKQLTRIKKGLGEIPLLFTLRTTAEGGYGIKDPEQYMALNSKVAQTQLADLIDVEINRSCPALVEEVHRFGGRVIASYHDFKATPDEKFMIHILSEMNDLGADILKLAVMPKTPGDVLRLLAVTDEMRRLADRPVVTMSMGGLGVLSRLSGEFFGSAITFGALKEASAPGQIPAGELKKMLAQLSSYRHTPEHVEKII